MSRVIDIISTGLFSAAVAFLVAAGLQVTFGVQRVVNLATGSCYALGAFLGVSAYGWADRAGVPAGLIPLVLVGAGVALSVVGLVIERVLRLVAGRDEAFQLLVTFALVLVAEDVTRMVWGPQPRSTGGTYLAFGTLEVAGAIVPVYNLVVIGVAVLAAVGLAVLFARTRFGRIARAAAEDPDMAAALGVDPVRLRTKVFVLGTVLSTIGGALVIPTTVTQSEMGVELIVVAFAVIVIGGLGSMTGAAVGALVVGLTRAATVSVWPELDLIVVYLVVIAVLVARPEGLFGRAGAVIER